MSIFLSSNQLPVVKIDIFVFFSKYDPKIEKALCRLSKRLKFLSSFRIFFSSFIWAIVYAATRIRFLNTFYDFTYFTNL